MAEILAFIGLFIILGAVGTDDYYTMQGIYHSLTEVILTSAVGFILTLPLLLKNDKKR